MLFHPSDRFRHVTFADTINGAARALDHGRATEGLATCEKPDGVLTADEESFVSWLFRQRRLNAEAYREETLSRRLPACLRTLRAGSVQQARMILQRHPELIGAALSAMLIGVTSLFRDPQVFQCLRNEVLPQLVAEMGGRLRVWSVGCSDGAEIYSVAMLLDRLGVLDRCELLGTDCRADAIAQASLGRFDNDSLRALPAELRLAYFSHVRGQWQISERMMRQVRWRVSNVTQTIEPGQWDLILCRNVAMYLRGSTISILWERLQWALGPGGVLVLGKAERPVGQVRLGSVAPCIYRRSYQASV